MAKDETQLDELKLDQKEKTRIDSFKKSRIQTMMQLVHANENKFSIPNLCQLMNMPETQDEELEKEFKLNSFHSIIEELKKEGYPICVEDNVIYIREDKFSDLQNMVLNYLKDQVIAFYLRNEGDKYDIKSICFQHSCNEEDVLRVAKEFIEGKPKLKKIKALKAEELISKLRLKNPRISDDTKKCIDEIEQLVCLGYARKATNCLYLEMTNDSEHPNLILQKTLGYDKCGINYGIIQSSIDLQSEKRELIYNRIVRILINYQNLIADTILSLFRFEGKDNTSCLAIEKVIGINDDQLNLSIGLYQSRGMNFRHENDKMFAEKYSADYECMMRIRTIVDWFTVEKIPSIPFNEIAEFFGIGKTILGETFRTLNRVGIDVNTDKQGIVTMSLNRAGNSYGDEETLRNQLLNVVDQGFIDGDSADTLLLLLSISVHFGDSRLYDDTFYESCLYQTINILTSNSGFSLYNMFDSREEREAAKGETLLEKQKKRALKLIRKYALQPSEGTDRVNGFITQRSNGSFVSDFFLRLSPLHASIADYSKIIAMGSVYSKYLLGVVNQTRRIISTSFMYSIRGNSDLLNLDFYMKSLRLKDENCNSLCFDYRTNAGNIKKYNDFRACFVSYSQDSGKPYVIGYAGPQKIEALRLADIMWDTLKYEKKDPFPMEEMKSVMHEMFDCAPEKLNEIKVEFNVECHPEVVKELEALANARSKTCCLHYNCGKKYKSSWDPEKETVKSIMYDDRVRGLGDLSRFLRRYADIITIRQNEELKEQFRTSAMNVVKNYSRTPKKENPNPVFEKGTQEQKIYFGEKFQNSATVAYADSDKGIKVKIDYSVEAINSDDPEIARVDKLGNVTALRAGSVKIRAMCRENDIYAASSSEYTLTINKRQQAYKFKHDTIPSIFVNESFVNKILATDREVKYFATGSSEKIVSINDDGTITALKPGKAVITAIMDEDERYLETTSSFSVEILSLPDKELENGILIFKNLELPTAEKKDMFLSFEESSLPSPDKNSAIKCFENTASQITIEFKENGCFVKAAEISKTYGEDYQNVNISYHVIKAKPTDPEIIRVTRGGKVFLYGTGDVTIIATCMRDNKLISCAKYGLHIKKAPQKLHFSGASLNLYEGERCIQAIKGLHTRAEYSVIPGGEDIVKVSASGMISSLDNGNEADSFALTENQFYVRALNVGTTIIKVSACGDENYEATHKEIKVNVIKPLSLSSPSALSQTPITVSDDIIRYSPICRMGHILHILLSLREGEHTSIKRLSEIIGLPISVIRKDIYDICNTKASTYFFEIRLRQPGTQKVLELRPEDETKKKAKKKTKHDEITNREKEFIDQHKYDNYDLWSECKMNEKKELYLLLDSTENAVLKKSLMSSEDYVYKSISYVKPSVYVIDGESSDDKNSFVRNDITEAIKSGKCCVVQDTMSENKAFAALPISLFFDAIGGRHCVACINESTGEENLELSFHEVHHFKILDETVEGNKMCKELNGKLTLEKKALAKSLLKNVWVPENIPLSKSSFTDIKIKIKKDQPNVERKIRYDITHIQKPESVVFSDGKDGSIILRMKISGGMTELKRWILSYGGSITVMEPVSLKNDICIIYKSLLASLRDSNL